MEIVSSIATSIITKIAESSVVPIERQFGYLIHYNKNIKDLQEEVKKLTDQRAGLQLSVETAKRNGEVIAPGVESWVIKVDGFNSELGKFLEEDVKVSLRCLNGWCPDLKSRYSLSRKAKKRTQDVVKLQEDGKFDQIAYPAPPSKVGSMFVDRIRDFKSRTSIMDEVLKALKDDELNIFGICGMGGVGKTTMVKNVIKRVEEDNLFDEIALAVVSQNLNVMKIQGGIADVLGLKFDEESVFGRARRLHDRIMNCKRILIVLDDVWTELDFETIGIPSTSHHKGCKILLTSRNEEVCSRMKSQKNFKILVLSEEEAWDLFRETTSDSIEHPDVLSIAKEVAKECGGLPIAIVTVGKALEGKDKYIWEYALQQLKKSAYNSEMQFVFSRIEWSYKFLEDGEAKVCFLLCCLFPEDFDIPLEYLVRYGVGLGLFKDINSLYEARLRVHAKIDKLRRSFLLLESDKKECIKMHDVVRDAAISIASKDEHMFLVRCDNQVEEWPSDGTDEHCTAISLECEKIKEYPSTLDCPKLELLQLRNSECSKFTGRYSLHPWMLRNVPYKFFQGLKELKVLALLGMSISSQLPPLQVLNKLRTLCLEHCQLEDIFILGKLENLEVLSFVGSNVLKLSIEIGQLRHLRLLDLTDCSFTEEIAPGILSRLSQLEELYMRDCFYFHGRDISPNLSELKLLSHLKALDIYIADAKNLPKNMLFHNLIRYKVSIGCNIYEKGIYFQNNLAITADARDIMESGIYQLLKKTEVLFLNLKSLKNVLYELDQEGFPLLKHLSLWRCYDLEYLINAEDSTLYVVFPLLESLSLVDLNIREICHGQLLEMALGIQEVMNLQRETTQPSCFGNLRSLCLSGCFELKNVFPLSLARNLVQLQDFEIQYCIKLEEIFSKEERKDEIAFPKLTNLKLGRLPKLVSFCKGMDDAAARQPSLNHQVKPPRNLESSSSHMNKVAEIQYSQFEVGTSSQSRALVPLSNKIFTPQWMSRLPNLEKVDVQRCELLEVIFDFQGQNVEESKTLGTLVHLKILNLVELIKLTHVWKKVPKGFCGFKKLRELKVEGCNSLRYLFSPSIAKLLVELQTISVSYCAMMENIVARETEEEKEVIRNIVFHNVTDFRLHDLPELVSFCPDGCTFEWPSLNHLSIFTCPKMKTFSSTNRSSSKLKGIKDGPSTSSQDVALNSYNPSPALHSHSFLKPCFGCLPLRPIIKSQKTMESSYQKEEKPNLDEPMLRHSSKREVTLTNLANLNINESCIPLHLMNGLQHLQEFELVSCDSMEVLFDLMEQHVEEKHSVLVLNCLEVLNLSCLPKLMHTWKVGTQKIEGFHNLKQLDIYKCNGLRNIFPLSIVKLLVNLEKVRVGYSELVEEIISKGGKEEKEDMVVFPQLNNITLQNLPKLMSFYSEACTARFPLLVHMRVVHCPRFETFVPGIVVTPKLKEVHIQYASSLSYPLRGDLNNTIRDIFEGKIDQQILAREQIDTMLKQLDDDAIVEDDA